MAICYSLSPLGQSFKNQLLKIEAETSKAFPALKPTKRHRKSDNVMMRPSGSAEQAPADNSSKGWASPYPVAPELKSFGEI